MTPESRQEALERHGLAETNEGFTVTLKGFQKGVQRALTLRAHGDEEAARMLALPPTHPTRWEYARCLQIDAFTREAHRSGF
ncbi:hypothetical protein AMK15_06120 [Streptomyces sp. MJM1172]|nr:hypothetical protein AMK15_06120 [Streptomyces sp. MJM1172]